jgi:hypothetical protein
MSSMSDIIKQMSLVPEKGLQNQQQLQQIKENKQQLVQNNNSITNHIRAYQEMFNGPVKKQPINKKNTNTKSVLVENDLTKIIGALQVVKELLDCNLTENTYDIANKVKKIINKI